MKEAAKFVRWSKTVEKSCNRLCWVVVGEVVTEEEGKVRERRMGSSEIVVL
jgi:hypothetical protein